MLKFQQGDVIIRQIDYNIDGEELDHLTLAIGEASGHSHRITDGLAKLIIMDNLLHLKIFSESARLSHEEHNEIVLPKGNYIVRTVREYDPFEDEIRQVRD